ncbi:hypothetical protein RFI_17791, partial [Reticulomyxa filosa]
INERVFIDMLKIFEGDPSVKKTVKRLLINESYDFHSWKGIALERWRGRIDRIAKEWVEDNRLIWELAKQTIDCIWKQFVKQIPVYSSSEIPGLKIPGVEEKKEKVEKYVFARIRYIHTLQQQQHTPYQNKQTNKQTNKKFPDEQNKNLKRTFVIPFVILLNLALETHQCIFHEELKKICEMVKELSPTNIEFLFVSLLKLKLESFWEGEEEEEEEEMKKKGIKDMRPITMLFNIANKDEQLENLLVKRDELDDIYDDNEPMIYMLGQGNKGSDVLVKLPGFCKANNKEVMLWVFIELKTFNKDNSVKHSKQCYETLEEVMSARFEKQENGSKPSNKDQLSEQETNNLKEYWIFPGELHNIAEPKTQLQKVENQQIATMIDVELWRQRKKRHGQSSNA